MPTIELTAVIRRPLNEVFEFLQDLSNYRRFLPESHFSDVVSGDAVGGRNAAELKWRALGKWWAARLEVDQHILDERLVIRATDSSFPFTWTWTLSELKKDRKGERTEVHLMADVHPPGGSVGSMIAGPFLERSLLKTYDPLMRLLDETLAGKKRSGLRSKRTG